MYYIGRFVGLPKIGVSDRQDLEITVFGQFRHFLNKMLHSDHFLLTNGYVPPQKSCFLGPKLPPQNVTFVIFGPEQRGVFMRVNATSQITRLYP